MILNNDWFINGTLIGGFNLPTPKSIGIHWIRNPLDNPQRFLGQGYPPIDQRGDIPAGDFRI